jgi:hypothetical protein
MKEILKLIFWALLAYLLLNFFGYIAVAILILFVLFVNIVTWDSQMETYKKKHGTSNK